MASELIEIDLNTQKHNFNFMGSLKHSVCAHPHLIELLGDSRFGSRYVLETCVLSALKGTAH